MASIGKDKHGSRYVQYEDVHRARRTLRLGKVSKRDAEVARLRVERLVAAQIVGSATDAETSRWVSEVGEKLSDKLAQLGLIETRKSSLLGAFVADYKANRTDVKEGTRKAWAATHKSLLEYFGEKKPLRSITEGDAKAWRRSISPGRAENTVRKRTAIAKTLFNSAVDHRLIERNPFDGLKSAMIENKKRMYFVTAEESRKVLEACPSTEWRTIFALARFGGLRCPTEILALKWEDVLWDKQRFVVHCIKTEHHPGKDVRIVPIFPELAPYLEKAFDEAAEGSVYVIEKTRNCGVNLRTHLLRIVKRAGLKPWPKLFQNLRATRETELCDTFPVHVACEWIGNSRPVALKHYLSTTEDHFAKASDSKSAANALQSGAEQGCTPRHTQTADSTKQGKRYDTSVSPNLPMGDTGFEPVTSAV